MSNVISLVPPPPHEDVLPLMVTHNNVLQLMQLFEEMSNLAGFELLDCQVYPQLQKLHTQFLETA